jgi:hypothetical protein
VPQVLKKQGPQGGNWHSEHYKARLCERLRGCGYHPDRRIQGNARKVFPVLAIGPQGFALLDISCKKHDGVCRTLAGMGWRWQSPRNVDRQRGAPGARSENSGLDHPLGSRRAEPRPRHRESQFGT